MKLQLRILISAFATLLALTAQAAPQSIHSGSSARAAQCTLMLERLRPTDRSQLFNLTAVTKLEKLIHPPGSVPVQIDKATLEKVISKWEIPQVELRSALDFLKTVEPKTQLNLAVQFEEFAREIIRLSDDEWLVFRAFGSDGSIVYWGPSGYMIVIDTKGVIFKGRVRHSTVTDDGDWPADYTDLKPLDMIPPAILNRLQ